MSFQKALLLSILFPTAIFCRTHGEIKKIFFVTNRTFASNSSWSADLDKTLHYGMVRTKVPSHHQMGNKEDITILTTSPMSKNNFYENLNGDCLLYVPGGNSTFEASLKRISQLSYDIGFKGTVLFFSWPSLGKLFRPKHYYDDEEKMFASKEALVSFLKELREINTQKIHLLGHSLGATLLINALETIAEEHPEEIKKPLFHHVILAATDMDSFIFKRIKCLRILPAAQKITLYGSPRDRVLLLSRYAHPESQYRAGEIIFKTLPFRPMDSIDVSSVDNSFWNHRAYGASRAVLTDLALLLNEDLSASQRNLKKREWKNQISWRFRK